MNLRRAMLAGLCLVLAAAAAWFILRPPAAAPPPAPAAAAAPLATLVATQGPVTVALGGAGAQAAQAPTGLHEGDVVTTPADASAQLSFPGGNKVHLGPSSSIVIGAHGSTEAQLGAVVLAGTARAEASGQGQALTIGTPVGVARLPAQRVAVLDIQFDAGVKVVTGDISLRAPGTASASVGQVLLAGQEMTLEHMDVPAEAGEVDGLALTLPPAPTPDLTGALTRERGRLRLKRPRTRAWRAVRAPASVGPGDRIDVSRRGRATVSLEPGMRLALDDGARLQLLAARGGEGPHVVTAALERGSAEVALMQRAQPPRAELAVAGTQLRISPTDREASVQVRRTGARGAEIYVRYGQLELGGLTVPAGQQLSLRRGRMAGRPRPAFGQQAIALRPGAHSEIFYRAVPPPVRFELPEGGAPDAVRHLQLARDPHFRDLVAAEAVHGPSFAQDRMPRGRSFWRAVDAPEQVGSVTMARDRSQVCVGCQRPTTLDNSGERVALRYAAVAPDVALRWQPVEGARGYTVRIYGENDLSEPRLTHALPARAAAADPIWTVPRDALPQGTYYWYVDALRDDAPTQTGPVNTLVLERDGEVDGLALVAPAAGAAVSADAQAIEATGFVAPGARLSINEVDVPTAEHEPFSVQVPLRPGDNQLVFRVRAQGRPDRYYVRTVVRRTSTL